jgi:hypothetical protein
VVKGQKVSAKTKTKNQIDLAAVSSDSLALKKSK